MSIKKKINEINKQTRTFNEELNEVLNFLKGLTPNGLQEAERQINDVIEEIKEQQFKDGMV